MLPPDATIGQVVIEMQARDPDSDASLIYYMEEPKQAFNPQGNVVDPAQYDYRVTTNQWPSQAALYCSSSIPI